VLKWRNCLKLFIIPAVFEIQSVIVYISKTEAIKIGHNKIMSEETAKVHISLPAYDQWHQFLSFTAVLLR
jgi:hypothetical protein